MPGDGAGQGKRPNNKTFHGETKQQGRRPAASLIALEAANWGNHPMVGLRLKNVT